MAGSTTKFTVAKNTAEGETLAVEVLIPDNPTEAEIRAHLKPVLDVLDDRMLEMNKRVVCANTNVRKLKPEVQMLVQECFELLYGRKQLDEVAKAVEKQVEDDQTFASDRELKTIKGGKS